MKKKVIYLADLTHRGMVLSSNVFPLSIGLIAAYLINSRPDEYDVALFKYPEDFSAAIEARKPDLIGFANYSWNFHISYEYARAIKEMFPEIPIVFGGPNYGLEEEEVEEFWRQYDLIDFYIIREGEEAFVRLLDFLCANEFNINAAKKKLEKIPNCHYKIESKIISGPDLPRLTLEDIPSPYLMGLMDKFFDESLGPMIHTTRGCPFSCAFCTEGSPYYNIVEQRMDTLKEELHYIAKRVVGPLDLYISDANFGMFKQDILKAEMLSEMQKQYGYPRYIHVSTGKNQKERVIEIAKMLDGALSMAASLQSTDPIVLQNVSRSNISVEKLTAVGKLANKVEAGTYSEIILGLPGDTFEAHRKSLRDCVEANFDNIRMYQLIMLPQTVLNTPSNRRKFGIKSKHRVMPRSFGRYKIFDKEFIAVESEEILFEHSSLSFDDYIRCRELDLTVELLHNGRIHEELQSYCEIRGLSWFDFILRFYEGRRSYNDEITRMYDDFRKGLTHRLWNSRGELEAAVVNSIDEMLVDERGTNEMSMGKATGFLVLFDNLNAILFNEMQSWLKELDLFSPDEDSFLKEIFRFSFLRKTNIMNCDAEFLEEFCFDIQALSESNFSLPTAKAKLSKPKKFKITHLTDQRNMIDGYIKEFGSSHDGLGKMLMKYPHIHRLFRRPQMLN